MYRRGAKVLFLAGSLALHAGMGGAALWFGRLSKTDATRPAKPTFVGETFDLAPVTETPNETVPVETVPVLIDPDDKAGAAEVRRARPRAENHGTGAHAEAEVALTYGAVGDRSASPVIVALARGFPQAASADPVWRAVPIGDAGAATLEIELADDGSMTRWSLGPGASPALRQAMVQTMALIGSRAFVARGAVTKLRVAATVTADAVRDGSDAVYAIHSEHEGDHASAYFSLSSGRRIDLVIRPL